VRGASLRCSLRAHLGTNLSNCFVYFPLDFLRWNTGKGLPADPLERCEICCLLFVEPLQPL
jgi:hypothetical protein